MKRKSAMSRAGRVTWSNPKRRKPAKKARKSVKCRKPAKKARKSPKKPSAKTYTKKIGRWRCCCKGRTVTCAGAKHSYQTAGAACAAYKKISSVKAIERFVGRYGKKSTKRVVVKSKRTNPCMINPKRTKKRGSAKSKKRRSKKRATRKTSRRNAPMSRSDAAVLKRVLKKHGF